MQIAVCNLYPNDYWGLVGVTGIEAPPELWWSSRERTAVEFGFATSEFLEIDFGRLRSMNFLNFNILQKPINITVEYDVWSFDSGIKKWQPVTRVNNERFDNNISFTPNAANPWKNCQYYFTNSKGDLLSTRYMRIRFDRRQEPWPNGDVADTFPWSVDVKNLRTARYVIDLNDTRGVLVQQGKVTRPIIDPVHYDDTVGGTMPKVIGIPSGPDVYTPAVSHNNETYINFMVSSVNNGNEIPGSTGGGGASWTQATGDASRARVRADANEAGHLSSDLPVAQYNYQFFTPWPTDQYGYMFAIGNLASVGINSTTYNAPWPSAVGTSGTASNTGYSGPATPAVGDLVFCFISVRGSQTAAVPTDTSGHPYTLVFSGTSPGGVRNYVYKRIGQAAEPPLVQTSVLSASADWMIAGVVFSTPSSTNVYLMDERLFVQTHPSDYVAVHTAAAH